MVVLAKFDAGAVSCDDPDGADVCCFVLFDVRRGGMMRDCVVRGAGREQRAGATAIKKT